MVKCTRYRFGIDLRLTYLMQLEQKWASIRKLRSRLVELLDQAGSCKFDSFSGLVLCCMLLRPINQLLCGWKGDHGAEQCAAQTKTLKGLNRVTNNLYVHFSATSHAAGRPGRQCTSGLLNDFSAWAWQPWHRVLQRPNPDCGGSRGCKACCWSIRTPKAKPLALKPHQFQLN